MSKRLTHQQEYYSYEVTNDGLISYNKKSDSSIGSFILEQLHFIHILHVSIKLSMSFFHTRPIK